MFTTSLEAQRFLAAGVLAVAASLSCFGLTGCERKEKVIDIETPGADV